MNQTLFPGCAVVPARGRHVPKHFQDRQAEPSENRRQGEALSVCAVPEAEPESGDHPGPLVLREMFEPGYISIFRTRV